MIPLRDRHAGAGIPVLTLTLIALNVFLYFWDRQFSAFGPSVVFVDLVMRPNEVVSALSGDRFPLVTIFTSMFLHGNLLHLLGNMLFLLTFGPAIESALGGWRFALYYLFWGVVAALTHVFVDPVSPIPTLGASGAIGGVLGCYFLLFPSNKIEVLIPIIFIPLVVSAWILLGLWFLWQILIPQEGVANWAHAGGFMAGMATVLIMGGRSTILKTRRSDPSYDLEY